MMDQLFVLIISRPGSLRQALLDLLSTIPAVAQVTVVDSRNGVIRAISNLHPNVVFLDASQPESELPVTPRDLKTRFPEARCIVIIRSVSQQASARLAGADAVILEGTLPEELVRLIETLG